MKNKFFVVLLIVVLALTAVLFVACNKAPTAEYCTIIVEYGIFATDDGISRGQYEFKIIKDEYITINQVFNKINPGGWGTGYGYDLFALSEDGLTVYDESQPVERDMKLCVLDGMCFSAARVTVVAKSDRMKKFWELSHSQEEKEYFNAYKATTFFHNGIIPDNNTFAKILGLETTDFQFQLEGDETIYNNINEFYSLIFDRENLEYDEHNTYGGNVFCTPNRHYHIPNVIIYLY
ncbi:MAG: hypothetical protein IJY49_01490 [Clostridia bacterium]|nr:hypothetical protein [Clostridia bacterium]